ncbi:hypothetical protein AY599_02140 [Leptolyngbya valderiana BDU 20041]|nr:hypothetical protein AY599_02140 [Leptolyngbya valderiana BDU 20041]
MTLERAIQRFRFPALALAGLALFAVDFYFLDRYASAHMRADYWRHFDRIILPFLDRFDPGLLFINHHHNAVLHLHQLASLILFDLDLGLDAIFIALMAALTAALLFRAADGAAFVVSGDFPKTLAAALPALYLLGPNNSVYYDWPLIGLQIYTWLAIAATAVVLRASLARGLSRRRLLVLCAAVLGVLVSHFSLATLYLAALCGALAAAAVVRRERAPLLLLAPIAAIWLVYAVLLRTLLPGDTVAGAAAGGLSTLAGRIADPGLWSAAVHRLISAAVFDVSAIAEAEAVFTHPAVTVLVLFLAVASTLVALRTTPGAIVTTALLLGGFAFLVTSTLARDGGGASTSQLAFMSRYQLTYLLAASGFLANVLIAASAVSRRFGAAKTVWLRRAGAGLVLIGLAAAMQGAWRETADRLQFVEVQNTRLELELYMAGLEENTVALPRRIVGANHDYEPVLEALKARRLNVFSPHYRAGAALADFMDARSAYLSGADRDTRVVDDLRQVQGDERFACTQVTPGALVRIEAEAARRVGAGVRVISEGADRLHANAPQGRSVYYARMDASAGGRVCVLAGVRLVSLEVRAP